MANQQDAKVTPIEPGLVSRIAAGLRYMITGAEPAWFGAEQPLAPVTTPQEQPSVEGRQFDFPVGFNTWTKPRQSEPVSFEQMRNLADGYDLLRLVIETRKDQLAALNWTIKPKDEKQKADGRCAQLIAFFESPDQEHSWDDWLRMLLEDLFVLDAPAVYVRRTLGGEVYGLEPLDGSTIKRVITDQGRTPLPPLPAYQQILKGVPAIDYTTDELVYKPRNLRTHKIYGYSPVEQIIMTVNIALRRQLNQLSYYTEGNVPNTIFRVPASWNPDQIKQFQLWWDSITSGQSKHIGRFIPEGPDPIDTKAQALKDEYDEWLARIVCFCFSISPTAFVKQQNRATADSEKDRAIEEGLGPLQKWVKGLIDLILARFFGITDLEFGWAEEAALDPLVQAQVTDTKVRSGRMTINEARAQDGMDPIDGGDTPLIYTASGAVTLDSVLNPPDPPPMLPGGFPGGDGDNKPPADDPADGDNKPDKGDSEKGAQKVYKRAKKGRAPAPIDRNRDDVVKLRAELQKVFADYLTGQAPKVAKQIVAARESVGKMGNMDEIERIIQAAGLDDLDLLMGDVSAVLNKIGRSGSTAALLQVGITDATEDNDAIFDQVNAKALEYAKQRAAEMVGKRVDDDGELIDNPDAKWVIDDSTRDMLRSTVSQAIDEGWSNDKLADAIEDAAAFDEARAENIARTETAYADVAGNMEAYRASGVVNGKTWLASAGCCEDCQALDGVTVGLDEDFPNGGGDGPPLHPQCECDVVPELDDESDQDNQEQDE